MEHKKIIGVGGEVHYWISRPKAMPKGAIVFTHGLTEVASTKKEGSGLGLYISKTLMEKMNGEMICKNEVDGFSVILLIPLS